VDWDGKLSSVIFLPRCDFRCPFCHNYALVLHPEKEKTIPFERVEEYLEKQKIWLDGVCVTGGEPTLHRDLPEFCSRLKALDVQVKIDTNGANPTIMKELIEKGLIDYVAMDIKAPLTMQKYSKAIGVDAKNFLGKVKESVKMFLSSGIDYEFRTTVVPTLHTEKDIEEIARDIRGCKKYVLQKFDITLGKKTLDPAFTELKPFTDEEMKAFFAAAQKYVPNVMIR
jgi:pyruvate formate lyase activating enzyme